MAETSSRNTGAILAALIVLVAAAFAGAYAFGAFRHEHHAPAAAAPRRAQLAGCTLLRSADGYPPSYITHSLSFTKHPPLPTASWYGPAQKVRFRVLFHSLFHGYLVVAYRSDLSARERRRLRAWVTAERSRRVVAAPTPLAGAPLVDLAEWGWEARCDSGVPQAAVLERFLARRGA